MSRTQLEAVIWDMDGVIADTADYHYRAWQEVINERGVSFTKEAFMKHFGQRHDTIIKTFLGDTFTPAQITKISGKKQARYREMVTNNVMGLPGAVELIKALNNTGIKVAMGTSAVPDNVDVILQGLHIEKYFQAIAYGTEVPEGKPSPDIFLLAAEKLGIKPINCVVIEDAIAGVAAAKSAGMKCIAVTNSHPADKLQNADLIVDSLEKVDINTLRELFK
jgi:beta-phosphoglucomutase family hydrolase